MTKSDEELINSLEGASYDIGFYRARGHDHRPFYKTTMERKERIRQVLLDRFTALRSQGANVTDKQADSWLNMRAIGNLAALAILIALFHAALLVAWVARLG